MLDGIEISSVGDEQGCECVTGDVTGDMLVDASICDPPLESAVVHVVTGGEVEYAIVHAGCPSIRQKAAALHVEWDRNKVTCLFLVDAKLTALDMLPLKLAKIANA